MSGVFSPGWKWFAAATVAGAVLIAVWRELPVPNAPPIVEAHIRSPSIEPDPPAPPRAPPMSSPNHPPSAAVLEAHAREMRTVPPVNAIDRRMAAISSPCAAMQGSWRSPGGALLTLRDAGLASWAFGHGPEQTGHWLCMQNGAASVMQPDRTIHLSVAANGELDAVDSRDGKVTWRRAGP